jgi:hypothetical protein
VSEPANDLGEEEQRQESDLRRSYEISRARASCDVGTMVGGRRVSVVARTFARRDVAEHVLVEVGGDRYKAATICMDLWDIGRRQANDYVAAAVDRWEQEAASLTREQKRALLRARIRRIERLAIEHEKPLVVGDGGGSAHVERHAEVQEKAALEAIKLEAQLDGLLEQSDAPQVTVTVRTEVLGVLERHYGAKAVIEAEGESVPPKLTNGHNDGSNGHG